MVCLRLPFFLLIHEPQDQKSFGLRFSTISSYLDNMATVRHSGEAMSEIRKNIKANTHAANCLVLLFKFGWKSEVKLDFKTSNRLFKRM